MSLIDKRDGTPEQKTVDSLSGICTQVYHMVKGSQKAAADLVWKNQFGLTPQQVFNALGPDGAPLCAFSSNILELLALTGDDVSSPVPEGVTLTINPNGIVTVNEAPAPTP